MIKILRNIKNFLFAIGIGLTIGLIIWLFVAIYKYGVEIIWGNLALLNIPFIVVIICTIGGVAVGFTQKYFGELPKLLDEVLKDYKVTKRIEYRNIHKTFIASMTTLIFGGCVGPEASLSGIVGGISTFSKDLFERKKKGVLNKKYRKVLYYIIGLIGVSIFVILALANNVIFTPTDLGVIKFGIKEIVMFIPLVILGLIVGIYYDLLGKIFNKILKPLENKKVIKAVIGGLILGIAGTYISLILFSGEQKMGYLSMTWQSMSAGLLIITGLLKLGIGQLCIKTGWRGGIIFPIILSGVSLGYGFSILIGTNPGITILILTAVILGSIMEKSVFAIALMFLIIPFNESMEYMLIIFLIVSIGAILGSRATILIKKIFSQLL